MNALIACAAAAALLAGNPTLGQKAETRAPVVSTGKQFSLAEHLRKEGTTVFLFINETSAMEQQFLADLEKRLPRNGSLALRIIRLKSLEAPAAKQHEVSATPTAIVLDRFGRPLAKTSSADEIAAAAGKGLRTGRIRWIDEEDP